MRMGFKTLGGGSTLGGEGFGAAATGAGFSTGAGLAATCGGRSEAPPFVNEAINHFNVTLDTAYAGKAIAWLG